MIRFAVEIYGIVGLSSGVPAEQKSSETAVDEVSEATQRWSVRTVLC